MVQPDWIASPNLDVHEFRVFSRWNLDRQLPNERSTAAEKLDRAFLYVLSKMMERDKRKVNWKWFLIGIGIFRIWIVRSGCRKRQTYWVVCL